MAEVDIAQLASQLRAISSPLARALRDADGPLSPTVASVFASVFRHGPLTIGDLAARERLSAPTISRAVAELEVQGFVARTEDGDDRRRCFVSVTPAGTRKVDAGRAARDAWVADRIEGLSAADRQRLAAALPVLEHLLREQ